MQKETEKQMYSAPLSELLELTQESVICMVSGDVERESYPYTTF